MEIEVSVGGVYADTDLVTYTEQLLSMDSGCVKARGGISCC